MDAPGATLNQTCVYGAIPPDHYWRDDVFSEEIVRVFRPSWLCVGFTDDLQNHNDFVTCQIGPHSIVVQNFKGELKAFRNVCSHRFSRIQTEPCGNRRLQCPYHHWLYDAQGVPRGIPDNETVFGLSEADKESLALTAYRLETCGRFVFVRMDDHGPSLRDFLGEVHDHLEHFTQACPQRIGHAAFEWQVNWKIAFENASEGYHTRMVHKDSLDLALGEEKRVDKTRDHTILFRELPATTKAWWKRAAKLISLKSSERFPGSLSYVIFPNIIIMATYGASFVFQTFEPISTTCFRFNSTYWIGDSDQGPAQKMFAEQLVQFSETILSEDHGACLNVQAGVRDVPDQRLPLLGVPEARIAHFQRAYARHMEAA